jgi:hypothetical protein
LLVVGDPGRGDRLDIYPVGEPPLPALAAYPRTDLFPEPLITGSLTGVSAAYGAARDTNGQTWIIEDRSGGAVVLVGDSSELIATHRLPVEAAAGNGEIVLPIPMLARQQRLYIGLGTTLITLQSGQPPQTQELPSTIGALAGTAPHTLNRIAVSLEVGACLIWDGAGHHQTRAFADDMAQPVVGFNRGGYVIAASGRRFEVYDTKNSRLTLVAGDSLDKSSVLSVFPLPEPNRFGLFTADGNAIVYELGRRS